MPIRHLIHHLTNEVNAETANWPVIQRRGEIGRGSIVKRIERSSVIRYGNRELFRRGSYDYLDIRNLVDSPVIGNIYSQFLNRQLYLKCQGGLPVFLFTEVLYGLEDDLDFV